MSHQPGLQETTGHSGALTVRAFLLIALWFGVVCGLVEGISLLLIQRINWERWGPTVHVSEQIVWISAVLDTALFLLIALGVSGLRKIFRRLPALSIAVFVLTALTVYDWLILTDRLYHVSCLLLAVGAGVAVSRWAANHERAALRFWRRSAPWALATLVVAFAGIQGGRWWNERTALAKLPSPEPDSPNVLVIVVDTLRADHLSSYGYARLTSPNIDRLATQGVTFENALSTCSWSFPSHVSLLTGRYQFDHGLERVDPMPVLDWKKPDLGGFPTLGEALARRGYRTGAFSANRTYFSSSLGFGRGFSHFEDYFHSPADMVLRTSYGREFEKFFLKREGTPRIKQLRRWLGVGASPDADASHPLIGSRRKWAPEVNDELLRWIDRDGRQRPFFAFLNYFDVHDPYGGPRSYPKPSWHQNSVVDRYDNGVRYVDDAVGQLLAEFEKRGLEQKTLIVITSDHGESLGQHGMTNHGQTLYRELVHVPMIFWLPGKVPPRVRVVMPVTNASIPATVLNLLGTDAGEQFPEPALTTLWNSPPTQPRLRGSLSELAERSFGSEKEKREKRLAPTSLTGSMKSLVTNQWHLIVHKTLGGQLFDWSHDPGEMQNLIYTTAGQETARQLVAQMQDLLAGNSSPHAPSTMALGAGLFESSTQETVAGNGLYRIEAAPGSQFTIEVRSGEAGAGRRFDPVVAIEDASGQLQQSCRNAGDDHIAAPGVSDPTPDAFDDICFNDDINPGVDTDSRLEIAVPGAHKSPVDLYVRVSDWNGRMEPGIHYQIAVTPSENGLKVVAQQGQ